MIILCVPNVAASPKTVNVMIRVSCPVCDNTGEIEQPYDVNKYVAAKGDRGDESYFAINKETGEWVSWAEIPPVKVECFNCEGAGHLEFEDG